MSEERPRIWVGDQVWDPAVDREAVVTDVQGGVYYLRPVLMWAVRWTVDPDKLEITVTREELCRRLREES
ncbi:hypothetical protein ABZ770_36135 [Streptomyces sp. NPDC006654]|uniref:hypothetical protein n=1 Tax=Streptomyces sp. NPDC006654 TaxID=3156897 RepID=UPI0033C5FF1C